MLDQARAVHAHNAGATEAQWAAAKAAEKEQAGKPPGLDLFTTAVPMGWLAAVSVPTTNASDTFGFGPDAYLCTFESCYNDGKKWCVGLRLASIHSICVFDL